MTNEQIITLVKEHFTEEEVDDDGYCWIEYAGKLNAFLKFAKVIYERGYEKGSYDASIDLTDENV